MRAADRQRPGRQPTAAALAALLACTLGCGVERHATRPEPKAAEDEPAASGASTSLGDAALAAATYRLDDAEVTLRDGVGSAGGRPVRLLAEPIRGDLDRDGDEDAVVVLELGDGETGQLAIFVAENVRGVARPGSPVLLRPGARLDQITISERAVQIDLLELGLGDDPCCPTIRTERRFVFEKGGLAPAH